MKPINIYALTRVEKPELLSKVEKQMSHRGRTIKTKMWEIDGLKLLSERLQGVMDDACSLRFYYSYTMQKLGKEFDLLRIGDDYVINIELKSSYVTGEAIRDQLVQNKYYLSTLGKSMYFYTYISGQDRLMRLTNSDRLVAASFEELGDLLSRQGACLESDIEDFFQADKYLLSPITDPGRFLRQEYFLTFQQRDIKKQILKSISEGHMLQGFTGLPGTGKTILLYDIAMQLSHRDAVCLFHFGHYRKELEELDERLKRIDFYYCDRKIVPEVKRDYSAIFVDEGHGMGAEAFAKIREYAAKWHAPVIISYDNVDCVSEKERVGIGTPIIEASEDFKGYKLTNRIRLNSELSTFLRTLLCAQNIYRRDYPNVSVLYGKDRDETRKLIDFHEKEGYVFIGSMDSFTGKEFDKVVMMLDDSFYYDTFWYLRNKESEGDKEASRIMNLFHGLSRAKEKIAIVVRGNETLFEQVYCILQKQERNH